MRFPSHLYLCAAHSPCYEKLFRVPCGRTPPGLVRISAEGWKNHNCTEIKSETSPKRSCTSGFPLRRHVLPFSSRHAAFTESNSFGRSLPIVSKVKMKNGWTVEVGMQLDHSTLS
ncbi:hypothetical protein KOW79_011231 [Hemibagrus wyckioides]|uniref:Uncharacterized protein n=1 Tax=Hemibagrus wyckioides TaxID=337641 RepID=A0A9D3NPU0_9TELE|nr:hypothetical protein KOW79_011231 [Hemibagrus wyckioides]